jgi:peroxiredoxin
MAVGLLVLFVIAVARALVRGEEPDCHCFGQLRSAPAGWATLVRNLVLGAVAGLVLLDGPGASATGWLARLGSGELVGLGAGVLLLALIVAQAAFSYQLLRQNGRLLGRLDALEGKLAVPDQAAGLAVGTVAPDFSLPGLDRQMVSLEVLRAGGRAVMLVFTDPGCGPCEALLDELGDWQRQHAQRLTIALVSQGDRLQNAAQVSDHALANLLLQANREVAEAYHAFATPSAQLITAAGAIASPLAQGSDEIRTLLDLALDQAVDTPPIAHVNGNGALVAPGQRWRVSTPAKATLAAAAVAIATQPLAGEASAATGVAAIRQILNHATPVLAKDNHRVGAALKQRANHPRRVPTAAINALKQERLLLDGLHSKVAALRTSNPAKALTLDALSLGEQSLRELQRTLAAAKLKDLQLHAAHTRALSKRAQHAISRAQAALK